MASLHQAAHDEGKMNDRAHFARFVLQSSSLGPLCTRMPHLTSDDHLRVALSAVVELLAKCSASVALDVFSPPCQTKDEIVKFINGVIEPETETQLAKCW